MPRAIHILKDGRVLDSIEGYVVPYEDCPEAYHILAKILDRKARERRAAKEEARKKREKSA